MTILARAQAMEMKRCVSILYIQYPPAHSQSTQQTHVHLHHVDALSWHVHAGLSDANRRGSVYCEAEADVTLSVRHALFNGHFVHVFLLLPHARLPQRQRE